MSYSPWGHKELDTTEQLSTAHSTVQILAGTWEPPEASVLVQQVKQSFLHGEETKILRG